MKVNALIVLEHFMILDELTIPDHEEQDIPMNMCKDRSERNIRWIDR